MNIMNSECSNSQDITFLIDHGFLFADFRYTIVGVVVVAVAVSVVALGAAVAVVVAVVADDDDDE